MDWQFPVELLPMLAALLLSLGLAAFTLRYRDEKAARWLVFALLSVAGWILVYSMQVMSVEKETKLFFNNFRFLFVSLTTSGWLLFVLAYTDREKRISPAILGVIFAIPAITQVVIATNGVHHLMRESATVMTHGGVHVLEIDFGPWFWMHALHSYVAIILGIVLFFQFARETRVVSTTEMSMLIIAVLVSFVPAILDDFGYTALDYTPVFFSVTMLLFGYVVYGKELLELIPVARKTVVEEMRDGIVVMDGELRVIDYNPAAEVIFESDGDVVGKRLPAVSSLDLDPTGERQPSIGKTGEEKTDEGKTAEGKTGEISLDQDDGETRHFSYELSSIEGEGGASGGWLLLLQDVTEIKNRERELELLNRVVRHDIQNDMNVVKGYAVTAREEAETPELIEPIVESSEHAIELTEAVRDLVETITTEESLEVDPVELREVLTTELEKARATHTDATFELAGEVDPDVRILANDMVSSVFSNLFTNAVRHNDQAEPAITVRVTEVPESARVSIADNGPGVPDDRKDEVFGRGEKGLDSPGTGVGLYLVDTLTDQFGGSVWIEDNDPRGAIFVVEFERAEVATGAAEPAAEVTD